MLVLHAPLEVRHINHNAIAHRRASADFHFGNVTAQRGTIPDGSARRKLNVPNERSVGSDESIRCNLRLLVHQRLDAAMAAHWWMSEEEA
jgi:hypothetical protein